MISKALEMAVEHGFLLGKRKCLANQPADTWTQRVIQLRNVIGLAIRFADHGKGSLAQTVVCWPKVAEAEMQLTNGTISLSLPRLYCYAFQQTQW
jgi:hypothetical protein